jgi:hypothetical protein
MYEHEKNIEIYRTMVHEAVNRCRDLDMLDLVYKLIMESSPTLYVVGRLSCEQERSKAA